MPRPAPARPAPRTRWPPAGSSCPAGHGTRTWRRLTLGQGGRRGTAARRKEGRASGRRAIGGGAARRAALRGPGGAPSGRRTRCGRGSGAGAASPARLGPGRARGGPRAAVTPAGVRGRARRAGERAWSDGGLARGSGEEAAAASGANAAGHLRSRLHLSTRKARGLPPQLPPPPSPLLRHQPAPRRLHPRGGGKSNRVCVRGCSTGARGRTAWGQCMRGGGEACASSVCDGARAPPGGGGDERAGVAGTH